jgi:hypothetical protein
MGRLISSRSLPIAVLTLAGPNPNKKDKDAWPESLV